MARRTPSQYDWSKQQFDERILTKHITVPRRQRIAFVVAHHSTILGTGNGRANETMYSVWQTRQASAHYGVDGDHVMQFVWDSNAAWATANSTGNHAGISIEHANSSLGPKWTISETTWRNGARLAARLHITHKLGRPVSGKTLRRHSDFFATSCPGPFMASIWAQYVKEAQTEYDRVTKATPAPSKPKTTRHFEHRHLNTWGDDKAKGTASFYSRVDQMVEDLLSGVNPDVITLNEVQPDDIASWKKRLEPEGYDVVLADAGNLVAIPAGSEVRKAQTKYLPSGIQGEGRKEALGMVRAKINGHWEHIFVSHLDYRAGAKFDALRVKQAAWVASEAKRWAEVFELDNWMTHTTIGIDENSDTWVRDKAFLPAGFKVAIKSGIDAIYGNRAVLSSRTIATASDHPIVAVIYGKTVK